MHLSIINSFYQDSQNELGALSKAISEAEEELQSITKTAKKPTENSNSSRSQ